MSVVSVGGMQRQVEYQAGPKALGSRLCSAIFWLLHFGWLHNLSSLDFSFGKMDVIEVRFPFCHADQMGRAGACARNRTGDASVYTVAGAGCPSWVCLLGRHFPRELPEPLNRELEDWW